ncbi:hypothetical protein IF1G_00925 [Cordyceps javanica]|uniref:Uncharacterized protein n=1 Tax=Cordyceps javanica TaxID=43265 RepID=A0A545VGZ3_9HYPO|nr:hypothetical protein IF1G_00925 [Cordyceps javanica]
MREQRYQQPLLTNKTCHPSPILAAKIYSYRLRSGPRCELRKCSAERGSSSRGNSTIPVTFLLHLPASERYLQLQIEVVS